MKPWREIRRHAPPASTGLPDADRYADVYDAIDDAWRRSATIEPSASDVETLATSLGINDASGEFDGLTVYILPTVQVRVPSTCRLAIGLLQYGWWRAGATWHGFDDGGSRTRATLPDASRLLGRAIAPTPTELADLAWLLVPVGYRRDGVNDFTYGEPLAAGLRALERYAASPADDALREALAEASRRITCARDEYVADKRRWGRRPATLRFDKWLARLDTIAAR